MLDLCRVFLGFGFGGGDFIRVGGSGDGCMVLWLRVVCGWYFVSSVNRGDGLDGWCFMW